MTSTAKETFIEEIMPLIELSLDSIMEADVHQAVDKYCGGIMNFRKLGLLFDSDNMGKLITCCKENILSIHFEACIQSYFTEYLQTIHDIQSEYLEKFTGEKLAMDFHPITVTFDVPNEVSFNKSRENITSLNAKEIEDVWSEIARTGIDIGASFLSGGISLVYDCASFAYDAYDIYQSFNTQELEFNEVLELLLCDIFNEDMADEIQSLKEIMSYHLENNAEKIKLTLKESL